jgi:hypothetical protein
MRANLSLLGSFYLFSAALPLILAEALRPAGIMRLDVICNEAKYQQSLAALPVK